MTTQFGSVPVVKDIKGNIVASKWLQDDLGNYLLDPTTKKPYIVPSDFDLSAFIDKYAAMHKLPLGQTLGPFMDNFQHGRVDDLQRSYNGQLNSNFVADFRPAASFILGLAGEAAGLSSWVPVLGGGIFNVKNYVAQLWDDFSSSIKISGEFGNNPPNDRNIREGERFYSMLAQGIRIGVTAVDVNANTQTAAISYLDSIHENIVKGRAPDGSPIGVSVGDPNSTGQSIWIKSETTGSFTNIFYQSTLSSGSTTWEVSYSAEGALLSATTYKTDAMGATTVWGSGPLGNPGLPPFTITRDVDVSLSSSNYIVKKGDTLWGLAQSNGVSVQDYLDANPQITHPNLINIGQVINHPASVIIAAVSNTVNLSTNTNQAIPSGAVTQDGTSAGPSESGNNLVSSGDYLVGIGNFWDVNIANGNQAVAGYMTTDGFRTGNGNLGINLDALTGFGFKLPQFDSLTLASDFAFLGTKTNYSSSALFNKTPVDPLILDLNGDGVKLTNYIDGPVLFDIDNDGGSLEQTGWVSNADGIVVHDLNNDGKINNISEALSEYYNGVAGSNGVNGTKPFANGFAALKSLDSNGDNQFTSADAAWNNLRVWVDANHDGKTDAGELKTFASLGITSINLATTTQSGEVRDGNAVLARGTFTQSGLTQEAIAANFLANPAGSTITQTSNGIVVSTENGGSSAITSFVSKNIIANLHEVLDSTTLNVRHITGGAGNDTLTGDAQNNWLAGGVGTDILNGGAGDDVLLIDADDTSINGGDGLDVAQVIGDVGVTLNLAQSSIEIAVGGNGNDVFVGGGRSTVFVRGGGGDDVIIGGAANDVLSGEDGADLIDGGAGNDLIRGHRGKDQLMGGAGDDVLDGGLEDDTLNGGTGNDVLIGGRGDDIINGGEGIDVAQFSGSYADYHITKINNANGGSTFRVVDTRTGQDGADTLIDVEKISFSDVSQINLTLGSPLPVKDILSVNSTGAVLSRTGSHLLSKNQLLANDRDWESDLSQLTITQVMEAKGGTVSLTASGDVLFIPDVNYKGVMSFKYSVQDVQGRYTEITNAASGQSEAMKSAVYLQTADLPNDPLVVEQWYLSHSNVIAAWGTSAEQAAGLGYSGKGIRIGQFETGGAFSTGPEVFDYRHPDLQSNVDMKWLNTLDANGNVSTPQTFSNHATMVAGIMVAARNGEGGVGVAYNATLAGHYIQGEGLELTQLSEEITTALAKFKDYDVVNNSWGASSNFQIHVVPASSLQQGMLDAVSQGRDGLGTVIVMSGGNDRQSGANTNYNALTANRAVITTGSINAPGDLGALQIGAKPFSNPGASILISAPGSNINSTSRELLSDNGSTFGSQYASSQGTSFAAPIISGVVALMLEANSALGYRDIQTILAMTATKVNDPNGTDWVYNTAKNWNGGGMHVSHDYGFGEVDALAAVRLAETWHTQSVYSNEQNRNAVSAALDVGIADTGAALARTLTMASGLKVESAQITVTLTHQNWGDLIIKLISPSGTESILVNRPGKAPGSAASDRGDSLTGTMNFSFNSTHLRGEDSGGVWTLQVIDAATGQVGTLNNWRLDLYGASAGTDDVYVYTNEFASITETGRSTLNDTNGGIDILNASAVSASSTIRLDGGVSTIAGKSLTISGLIEKVYAGDGHDALFGNASNNVLWGGRGNDVINGGGGSDRIEGGAGDDLLTGGAQDDLFVIRKAPGTTDTITDFSVTSGIEKIVLVGYDDVPDLTAMTFTQVGANVRIGLGNNQTLIINNTTVGALSEQNFTFISEPRFIEEYVSRWLNPQRTSGTPLNDQLVLPVGGDLSVFGLAGDDYISSVSPNDLIDGGNGHDTLIGDEDGYTPYPGSDWIEGGSGNDFLSGGEGHDMLVGGSGADELHGGAGHDYLIGGSGDDYLNGGFGNDIITLDGDTGLVDGENFGFFGTRVGGAGADIFKVLSKGGGAAGYGSSGTQIGAYNLIADFNPFEVGEKIDLSAFAWITSLDMEDWTVGSVSMVTISSVHGADSFYVTLRGVTSAQLRPDHFIFADFIPGAVSGTAANDTLTGDAGANTIDGRGGADLMIGRTGDDTYIVDHVGDVINELPGGGFDRVQASVSYTLSSDVEVLNLTGVGNINATGNAQRNRLVGNSGNNRLDGGAEADSMMGGAGNDTYIVDDQLDTASENVGEGTDLVESSVSWTLGSHFENLTLTGNGNINATGNSAANVLIGNSGNNILDGAQGADIAAGGLGGDTYYVDNVGDTISEAFDAGMDTVYSSVNITLASNVENGSLFGAATTLTGNNLDNVLIGNELANVLYGGSGNDVLDGGTGADAMSGGAGDDSYVVDNVGDAISENAGEGNDTVISSLSYTLGANVENLILSGTGNLNGTGNAENNQLRGNSGSNTLTGGAGDDILDGAAGADTMIGGMGNDTYHVDHIGDMVVEAGGGGADTVLAGISYSVAAVANVENITLTGYGDINATGNSGNNTLNGNAGANVIDAGSGNDTLFGDLGNDTLIGGAGNDTYLFAAGSGIDVIEENDVSNGNADSIVFAPGILPSDVTFSRQAQDLIVRYGVGDVLTIRSWFLDASRQIEQVVFSDGTQWSAAQLSSMINSSPTGTVNVTGIPMQNQVLIATNNLVDSNGLGTLAYQWQSTLDGATWFDISGANQSSYALQQAQVGKQVRVAVSYIDGGSTQETVFGPASTTILNLNDAPSGVLAINGQAENGQVLTASNLLADADGMNAVSYQWQSSLDGAVWTNINGAVDVTYVLNQTQIGKHVRVVASYIDGYGTAETVFSPMTSVVTKINFNPSGSITLEGDASQYQTLVARNTITDANGMGSISYQWQRSTDGVAWINVIGATQDNFGLGQIDVGNQVRVVIAFTDQDGTQESVTSAATPVVVNVNDAPNGSVLINGSFIQNQLLTANALLSDTDGLGPLAYQWQSTADGVNWTNISGATTSQFALQQAQVGRTVRVIASYTDALGTAESMTSAASGVIANINDLPAGLVTLNGLAKQGSVLTVSHTVTDADGLGVMAYQWQRSNDGQTWLNIENEIATSYSLKSTDIGYSIRVVAIYTDGQGTIESITATGTALVTLANARHEGTSGADVLTGGAGDDVFIVNHASDQVVEALNGGIDTALSSITYTLAANVENLTLTGTNAIDATGNALDNVLIGNAAANRLSGGAGADILRGGAGDDTYIIPAGVNGTNDLVVEAANEGVDSVSSLQVSYTLSANVENLILSGLGMIALVGNGNELSNRITGNGLANTLNGGAGNDILLGGLGSDTYTFSAGSGVDTIIENDATAGNSDIAQWGAGIDYSRLWFTRVNNNLNVSVIGTTDRVVMQDWYSGNAYHVEQFKSGDGKTMQHTNIDALVQAMASFTPPASGQTSLPPNYANALNPVLAASWQ